MKIFNVKIILLHFQHVFEQRGRTLVWFMVTCINPFIYILFWKGVSTANGKESLLGWGMQSIISYYVLFTIAAAFLMSHTEEDIAVNDIQYGQLSNYLLKPFSYYWKKLFEELPYRVIQGFFGLIIMFLLAFVFGYYISVSNNIIVLLLSFFVIVAAFFIAFTYKAVLGLLAFWFTDVTGLFSLSEIVVVLFAGYTMPLELMPKIWSQIADILPFSSMLYYPIIAVQGRLNEMQLLVVIVRQLIWLGIFFILYKIIWRQGIKKFTASGQ